MNREKLIEKAREFYPNTQEGDFFYNGHIKRIADFALDMFEAGQRADRERILETLDALLRTQNKYELIEAFLLYDLINKLRQTAPADSGE